MAIGSAVSGFKSGFANAWNLGNSAEQKTVAALETQTLTSGVPKGKIRKGTSMISVPPTCISACKTLLVSAYNLGNGASQQAVAPLVAQAVSVLAPIVPTSGISVLKTILESAWDLGNGAEQKPVANISSTGMLAYYQSGGVV